MKGLWILHIIGAWLIGCSLSSAQVAQQGEPPRRFDSHGSLAWANVSIDGVEPSDNWDNGVAQGIAGIGWYWTDHLKTEVDLRLTTEARLYQYETVSSPGRVAYRGSELRLDTSSIGIGQLFQFRRNAWVHPYVGLGIDLQRESLKQRLEPVIGYDEALRTYREIEPGRDVGPSVSWDARPFAVVGVKAYVSPRAFFRSDFRIGFGERIDQVVMSAGFGVDY